MSVFSPRLGGSDSSTISEALAQANLDSAENLVLFQMGWTGSSRDLPYDLRLIYNRALSEVILRYPGQFTTQMKVNASESLGNRWEPLEDTAFDWSDFGYAFMDNALKFGEEKLMPIGEGFGDLLASVGSLFKGGGKAIENTSKVAQYAVPVLVLGLATAWVVAKAPKRRKS